MITVMVVHEVDDVEYWLASAKRAEFFAEYGITVKEFTDPEGGNDVGAVLENVPSLDALTEAMQTPAAAAAMEHDGVHPDTIRLFVAS